MTIAYFTPNDVDYVDHFNLMVDAVNAGSGGSAVTSVTATSPVVSSGGTTPVISMPAATTSVNGYLTSANWNTFNGKASISDITVTNLTGTVGFDKGGTGQVTQQAAMNALAAAVTTGSYLRGNGTNVVMSTIQAGDVPTLNQNTTGTAAIATTATTTNDVATATTVYPLWSSATSGNNGVKTSSTKLSFVPSTGILTATGFAGSGASLTSIPNGALTNSSVTIGSTSISLGSTVTTFTGLSSVTSTTFVGALTGNASTATTAGNVTGVVASANGGTGVNNGSSTLTMAGSHVLAGAFTSTFTFTGTTGVTFPTSGTLLSTAAAVTVPQGGTGLTTLTSGSVLVGNGTSSPTLVAPSTSGNVLTSNGTSWVSSAPSGGTAITVKDEGSTLTTSLTSLDFVGAGVSASNTGGAVTVTITGGGGSGGTVTSASIVSANGFAGSVANATTTPAITLSTTVTGLVKGNGTSISAATSGTDYSAGTSALATGILKSTTTTGTLSIATAGDFPTLNQNTTGTAANVTGTVAVANGGTGVTSSTGTGSVVLSNTPTLVTPVLGVASATSVNKVAITAPATSATLTIADGKTLTANNSLTFSGTDASTLNIGTGGTLGTAAYTASSSYAPAAGNSSIVTVGTVSSGTWNGSVIGSTYGGTGVNNGSNTLTLGGNHTNSGAFASTFTFTGTTTVTFPTSGTLAILGANTFTGTQDLNSNNLTNIKVPSLISGSLTTTSGTVNIDWTAAAKYVQDELTGTTTYTFTAPANAGCMLRLQIKSDGTSAAQTVNFPANVRWVGSVWTHVANKHAFIDFEYDGTDYWAMGGNEV